MKKFFKKIVNKVKEVIHMAVKVVKDGLEVNSETINTFGASFVEYLENKDNIKAAEKEKVVDVVEDVLKGTVNVVDDVLKGTVNVVDDVLKGTVNVVKAIDRNPLKYAIVSAGLGICVAGAFISVHLANKLA